MKKIQSRQRPATRGGESTFERAARERSRRARAHLERTRQRNQSRARAANPWRARAWVAAAFGVSLVIGLLAGDIALERALALRGETPRLAAIDVLGNGRLAARDVAAATGLEKGTAISDIDPAVVEARLVGHAWIADARVVGLPSGTLVVWISERAPVAVLREDGGASRLVDAAGVAFAPLAGAPQRAPSAPALVALRAERGGRVDAATLRRAIRLGRDLAATTAFAADRGGFEVLLPREDDPIGWRARRAGPDAANALEVVLGAAPFDDPLARLSRLFSLAPEEAFSAGVIDLRFADQAVLRTRLASG